MHFNTTGYTNLALNVNNNFFNTVFLPAVLSSSTTSLSFGDIRIGTSSANQSVTVSNTGPNFTKVLSGLFPTASGEFTGGGASFLPLFKDPTLGSDTASAAYGFTPTNHGLDSINLTITSNSGNRSLQLTGRGVGPTASSTSSIIDLGYAGVGDQPFVFFNVKNSTTDPDLGNLTNLTLHSATITGTDAAHFSLLNFTPGTVVAKGTSISARIKFDGTMPPGTYTAMVNFQTDEGAAFGGTGAIFSIPITITVVGAPTADAGGPYSGPEAALIGLSGSGTGMISSYDWDLDNDGIFETPGQNVYFTASDNGVYVVKFRTTGLGGSTIASTTVDVHNVAPLASVTTSGPTIRGLEAVFNLFANDVSSVDQSASFDFAIDWDGDGIVDQNVSGGSGMQVTHAYAVKGTYTIKLTATDKDGETSSLSSLVVNVTPYGLVNDGGGTHLIFGGGTGDDDVEFQQIDATTILVKTLIEDGVAVNLSQSVSGVTGKVIAYGLGGNDKLVATALVTAAVEFQGGMGSDTLRGSKANDQLFGQEDVDYIFGQEGDDLIDGGDGADELYGEWENPGPGTAYGTDTIYGGEGNDTIHGDGDGGEGTSDALHGDAGDDLIFGDGNIGKRTAVDTIHGGLGTDTIYGDSDGGEAASDWIYGDEDNDVIYADGSKGSKTANDSIYGGTGDDVIDGDGGEGGADSILGEAGNDIIDTGKGSDFADGGDDSDLLLGGDGGEGAEDTLVGAGGNDMLVGGVGGDSIDGGSGEDLLIVANYLPANANSAAAIFSEWSSTRPFADRVANIQGVGVGPRNNGSDFLTPGSTVVDDNAIDTVLAGGSDEDWAILKVTQDVAPDLGIEDVVTTF
ncbi:MAG: choice-of-anchor D domain-containing protein [Planctomycetota bacterium]